MRQGPYCRCIEDRIITLFFVRTWAIRVLPSSQPSGFLSSLLRLGVIPKILGKETKPWKQGTPEGFPVPEPEP